jgi:AcrR family transcriptional regulator
MSPATLPPRPRRADALRNHERVLKAAGEVLAERGLEAGVDEVAARAGVGKATVYRSFPTKELLVAAVACERLRWLEGLTADAARSDDPWAAFGALLRTMAEAKAGNRIFSSMMASVRELPDVRLARADAATAMESLMARAQAQGPMRADATPREVHLLFAGVARMLADEGESDPAVWRRHADLIVAALRA